MELMSMGDLWQLVQGGGDVAIYAILYYAHSINNRVNTLEVKHSALKSWVARIDVKMEKLRNEP